MGQFKSQGDSLAVWDLNGKRGGQKVRASCNALACHMKIGTI